MTKIKKCAWCGDEFTPTHGNSIYHTVECEEASRLDRQKKKRDPIARFFPIMMSNHEVIDLLNSEGKTEMAKQEIEAYQLDLSLCRHLQPPPEHEGKIMLDFGEYYLITEPDFLTFKIFKHATYSI
jgi:hypothetical protein